MGAKDVSTYAAPTRATSLYKLLPTYIKIGAADLYWVEDVAYALYMADELKYLFGLVLDMLFILLHQMRVSVEWLEKLNL